MSSKRIIGIIAVLLTLATVLTLFKTNLNIDDPKMPTSKVVGCQKDSKLYVGLSEGVAANRATKTHNAYRVVIRDGVNLPVTEDYSPDRLNFELKNGLVVGVTCG